MAPNSPKLRANPSIAPVKIPGTMRGKLTEIKIQKGDAPRVRAADSNLTSILSKESLIALTIRGKAITEEATTAPRQENAIEKPGRKNAIVEAINDLKKKHILIIAGKGHEKIQILKNKTVPFDDVKVVKKIIKKFK